MSTRRTSSVGSASNHKDWRLDCKVYVGDLGYGAAKQELEDAFSKYGQLKNVWIARRPPGFAFIEFVDPLDAEDATRALDGTRMNGRKVRVEMSSGKSRWGSGGPPKRGSYYGGGRDEPHHRPRRGRSRSYSPPRRGRSRSRSRSETPPRRRSRSRSRGRGRD